MALKKVSISLPRPIVEIIDQTLSEQMGGRSEAIRTIITMYLLKEGLLHGR